MNMNAVSSELVIMLNIHMIIDGKEFLPHALRNEDVMKEVLMSWTHVEPIGVTALNETTFLVTYSSGILADEIVSAIEKIDEWLGKPVVITCDEVTTAQLSQVKECGHFTMGVESVVFNTSIGDMRSDFNQSVQSGYHSYVGSPAVLGASGTTIQMCYHLHREITHNVSTSDPCQISQNWVIKTQIIQK